MRREAIAAFLTLLGTHDPLLAQSAHAGQPQLHLDRARQSAAPSSACEAGACAIRVAARVAFAETNAAQLTQDEMVSLLVLRSQRPANCGTGR